eukprot:16448762-Heterocapsa_arctica.AAC.1
MAAAMAARRDAGLMRLSPGELAMDVAIGRKRLKLRADAAAHVLELPACPPRGCRARWPSRHLRKMSQAGAGVSLDELERAERARWLAVLVRVIKD